MGLDLELSELVVIRPIRTTASSADGITPTRLSDGDGDEAADNGCVTPTAAAVSPTPPRQIGVDVVPGCVTPTGTTSLQPHEQGDDDDTGCVTPTATSLITPPRRRGVVVPAEVDDEDAASFVTPTSAASVLRPSPECPPAPRKASARRSPVDVVLKRKLCGGGGHGQATRRCFFPVPRDLTKVFVARGGPAGADRSPPHLQGAAAKKARVHPVGVMMLSSPLQKY